MEDSFSYLWIEYPVKIKADAIKLWLDANPKIDWVAIYLQYMPMV